MSSSAEPPGPHRGQPNNNNSNRTGGNRTGGNNNPQVAPQLQSQTTTPAWTGRAGGAGGGGDRPSDESSSSSSSLTLNQQPYLDPRMAGPIMPVQFPLGWVDSASEASNMPGNEFQYISSSGPTPPANVFSGQSHHQPYAAYQTVAVAPGTQSPPGGYYMDQPTPYLPPPIRNIGPPVPPPKHYRMNPTPATGAPSFDPLQSQKDAAGVSVHNAALGNVPAASFALIDDGKKHVRTNLGNTKAVMALLSEMWIVNLIFILGGTFLGTFYLGKLQGYDDMVMWDVACFWKIGWLFPLPYCIICFYGLVLPYRTPKFLNFEQSGVKKRRVDNLYILTVTKGNNREAVYRAWNAHKHLERLHPCIRVHVLTDEPYYFENINCYTCPKSFTAGGAKYKARALEWYRQTMRYSEHDWVLHLDEESVIDDESVRACLQFIWYETDFHFGQGLILYNQYKYWTNWFYTVADAIRVGDDLSRFHLQYTYFHRPVFGAHGSFLLVNGLVENAVTWDLSSLTEDYQFAMKAWDRGFRCGKVAGIIREQSPLDFMGFLKQRRRWYVGIRRLPQLLPRVWATFWTLGIFSLYCTVASLILGFLPQFKGMVTPRWFGLLKDFSFCTFVYLYLIGIFIQDLDRGTNPLLVLVRIPATFVLQFVAVTLEALSVMYAIIFIPRDFDVIKK